MRTMILESGPSWRRWILAGLIAFVPLFFLRFTNDPFNVPKLWLLSAGIAVVGTLRLVEISQGAPSRSLTRLLVPAAALTAGLTISWSVSPYRGWALFGVYPRFTGLLPYVLVVLFGILVADAFAGHRSRLAWAIAAAAGIAGLYGTLQWIGADPFTWDLSGGGFNPVISTLGNPNFAGSFIAICLPVIAALWVTNRDRRGLLMAVGVVSLITLAGTRSETSWVAGASGLALFAGLQSKTRPGISKIAGIAGAGLGAVVVAGSILGSIVFDLPVPETVRWRGWWWEAAVDMWSGSPVVGRGPSSFAIEGVRHRVMEDAVELGYNFPGDPHSVPFALLAGTGLVGFLGFLTLLGWTFRQGARYAGRDPLSSAFLGAAVAYFIQSMASIDELVLRMMLWTVLAGLAVAEVEKPSRSWGKQTKVAKKSRRPRQRLPLRSRGVVAAVLLLGIGATALSFVPLIADRRIQRAHADLASGRMSQARATFSSAIALWPLTSYKHQYAFELGERLGEPPEAESELAAEMLRLYGYTETVPEVPAIRDRARQLHEWKPDDDGVQEESLTSYLEILELDPLNPLIRVETADVLVSLDRPDQALEILEGWAPRVGDEYPSLWGVLALVEAHLGHEREARVAIEKARSHDPEEAFAARAALLIDP